MEKILSIEKNILDNYIPIAEKKYVLDRGDDLKQPLLFSTNEFVLDCDDNGSYYEIDFDYPLTIGDIEIYDSNRLFEGKLWLDDIEIECLPKDSVYDFLHLRNAESIVKKIRYYPKITALRNGKPPIYILMLLNLMCC